MAAWRRSNWTRKRTSFYRRFLQRPGALCSRTTPYISKLVCSYRYNWRSDLRLYECARDLQLKGSVDPYRSMAIVKRCCWWSKTSSDGERGPKSVNILLGCFFLINYNLGDSYLTYPYAFYHAGYLAAIPTLLLITFMSTVAATWEVEVMARAQVGSVYRVLVYVGRSMLCTTEYAPCIHKPYRIIPVKCFSQNYAVIAFECPDKESVRHAGSRVLW